MTGICGSKVHRLNGGIPVKSRAMCFRHEAIGVIEALGERVITNRVGESLTKGDVLY